MASAHARAALRARLVHRTRYLRHHGRLVLAVLLGILGLSRPRREESVKREGLLAAFDLAAAAFLGAVCIMMARATTTGMFRPSSHRELSR
jgi:hypothetical protein